MVALILRVGLAPMVLRFWLRRFHPLLGLVPLVMGGGTPLIPTAMGADMSVGMIWSPPFVMGGHLFLLLELLFVMRGFPQALRFAPWLGISLTSIGGPHTTLAASLRWCTVRMGASTHETVSHRLCLAPITQLFMGFPINQHQCGRTRIFRVRRRWFLGT